MQETRINLNVTPEERMRLKMLGVMTGRTISEIIRELIATVDLPEEKSAAPAKPPKPTKTRKPLAASPAGGTKMLRLREVLARRGRGTTSHYREIQLGLFTQPVKIGAKASAWPESEVEQLVRARIAGKTDDEIRALVYALESSRSSA